MDMQARLAALATRIATEIKAVRSQIAAIPGASPPTVASVDFGSQPLKSALVTIANAAVTATSLIRASLANVNDTDINTPELLDLLHLSPVKVRSGSFDLQMTFATAVQGPIKIQYEVR